MWILMQQVNYWSYIVHLSNYYYRYSALGPVWAETRAQSGDWYGSGKLHPGQVLRGSLPLPFVKYLRRNWNTVKQCTSCL